MAIIMVVCELRATTCGRRRALAEDCGAVAIAGGGGELPTRRALLRHGTKLQLACGGYDRQAHSPTRAKSRSTAGCLRIQLSPWHSLRTVPGKGLRSQRL